MKKIICLCLTVLLMLGALTAKAAMQEPQKNDDLSTAQEAQDRRTEKTDRKNQENNENRDNEKKRGEQEADSAEQPAYNPEAAATLGDVTIASCNISSPDVIRTYGLTAYSTLEETLSIHADSPERNEVYLSDIQGLNTSFKAANQGDQVTVMKYSANEAVFAEKEPWNNQTPIEDGDIFIVHIDASDGGKTNYYKIFCHVMPFTAGVYQADGFIFNYRQTVVHPELEGQAALVVMLHGAHGSGDDNLKNVQYNSITAVASYFEKTGRKAVVLVPQSPADKAYWWNTDVAIDGLLDMIDTWVADEGLQISSNQIYATGPSMGCSGTFNLLIKRPGFFAGAIGVDGAPQHKHVDQIKDTPLYYFVGVPGGGAYAQDSSGFVTLLEEAGGEVLYAYDEMDHQTACTEAFKNDEALAWLFSHGKPKADLTASAWAQATLQEAEQLGIIPDCLQGKDLTKPITRAEFAAVSVKTYETMSGTAAIPAPINPFTDCNDAEILKAYNLGITVGISATTFGPDLIINREQAATMLTRAFEKVSLGMGWTPLTGDSFPLPYEKPTPFADDEDISDWAKDSVYFMAANGIIQGIGNNKFAPKAVTDIQKAEGYAQATREQALVIAVRMIQNLG